MRRELRRQGRHATLHCSPETIDALQGIAHSDKTMLNQFIEEGVVDGVKVLDFVDFDEGKARKRSAK